MSAAAFQQAIAFVLPHEEDFLRGHWGDERFVVAENVPGDSGGVTKYGIDQASHPNVDVANLTRDQTIAIYQQEWESHGLDALPDKLAVAMFDVWVNGGHAVEWLQEAINDSRPASAKPLAVDGALGPATISAAKLCDQDAVLRDFIAQRNARFQILAHVHPNDQQFLKGWEQRDADLTAFLSTPTAPNAATA